MRTWIAGLTVLLACGCDLSRNVQGQATDSQVSGHIAIPDGYPDDPATFCSKVELRASVAGAYVGQTSLDPTAAGCAYQIRGLPLGTSLSLSVDRTGLLACQTGEVIQLTPSDVSLKLQKGENHVVDFRAACGDQRG